MFLFPFLYISKHKFKQNLKYTHFFMYIHIFYYLGQINQDTTKRQHNISITVRKRLPL